MARVSDVEPREIYDPNDPQAQIREYIKLSATLDALEKRRKELRDTLIEIIDTDGYEDEKGNIQYELDAPIDGVLRLEKQGRRSRKLDETVAERIIEERNLADEVYEMVRVINEDALMAAFYEDKITEAELDEMFPIKVTWALMTAKK